MKQAARLLWLLPVLAAVFGVVVVRAGLGFQFPVPWPDETGFVSPSFNLATHGSLFDPGLNPDRIVMWMPPGYMIFLAAVIGLFGYDFATIRWTSALLVMTSLLLLARLVWGCLEGSARMLGALAILAAAWSPNMLVVGNLARMEALFCCLILLALSAGMAGRIYEMAALVLGAALVHFNAVYFLFPLVLRFVAPISRRRLAWPDACGWAALLASVALFAAYAVFVALHWHGFKEDMGLQFALKATYARMDRTHPAWMMAVSIVLLGARVLCTRCVDGSVLMAAFGVGFVAMARFGHEIWYDYGQPLGLCLLCLAWLARLPKGRNRIRLGISLASLACVISAGAHITPAMAQLVPTRAMFSRHFIAPAEIARVRAFVATLPPGSTVDFGLSGMENFFLADLSRVGAHWQMFNHSMTQAQPFRGSDWRVVCNSAEMPADLLRFRMYLDGKAADTGCQIMANRPH